MKTLKFYSLIFIAICLASCGGKKANEEKEIVVKPTETSVSGDLEGCFTVIDREYKATGDWSEGIITVEIERTDQELPFELNGRELCSFSHQLFAANVQVGFGIEFLDEGGNVLDKVSANGTGFSGSYDSDECVALAKLKPGKKGTIRFTVTNDAKDAVGFRITSAYQENEASESDNKSSSSDDNVSSDDNEDEELSSGSGSEDWDELLESYEEYVDKYISYLKKAAKGDVTALSEYPALMEKAQEFSNKLQNAQSDMSTSQWARYNKITSKMLKAAQEMQE